MGRAGAAGRCSRQRRDGSHKDPESTETTMSQRESRGRLGPKFRVLQTPQNLDSVAFLRSLFLPPTPFFSTASPPSSGQALGCLCDVSHDYAWRVAEHFPCSRNLKLDASWAGYINPRPGQLQENHAACLQSLACDRKRIDLIPLH